MRTVIVATANAGKMKEISFLLSDLFKLSSLKDHWNPVPVIPETGTTFRENAFIKANWVFSHCNQWALADDSGLEVDSLNGAPGILSARYGGEDTNDEKNILKLLDALKNVPPEKRTARYRCVMALVAGADMTHVAEGTCEGYIGFKPKGTGGFGYDPVFVPAGFHKTFAELDVQVKNAISHRGKALLHLRKELIVRYGR
jgi:XTP/dITP diphosphohydrolase